jgi:hypothetical protein
VATAVGVQSVAGAPDAPVPDAVVPLVEPEAVPDVVVPEAPDVVPEEPVAVPDVEPEVVVVPLVLPDAPLLVPEALPDVPLLPEALPDVPLLPDVLPDVPLLPDEDPEFEPLPLGVVLLLDPQPPCRATRPRAANGPRTRHGRDEIEERREESKRSMENLSNRKGGQTVRTNGTRLRAQLTYILPWFKFFHVERRKLD